MVNTLNTQIAKLTLLVAAVYLGGAFLACVPGYVLNDEAIYHLMVKSVSHSAGLHLWNGYRDYPSPELIPIFTTVHNGRLTPQYPYLYPLIGFLVHAASGYRGLMWLNILAFPAITVLCYLIALRLFHDLNLATLSAGIYACATFSFEYAVAALPHLLTTFLLLLACYLFLNAFVNITAPRRSALFCGFLIGLAMGIRLDAIFVLPCVMLPFLIIRPRHVHNMLLVFTGAVPGMLLLSVTNRLKFDSWSVLSYGYRGAMLRRYWPFGILGGVAVLVLWGLTRPSFRRRAARYWKIACVGSVILVSGLFSEPDVRNDIGERFNAFSQILVDFRLRETIHYDEDSTMSPDRGMWLDDMQGLKKSLLQSCPYLIFLLVPALHSVRKWQDQEKQWKFLWLFTIPVVYVGFYGYYGWHGGHSLNLRYLLPIFPFTSILTAYSWRQLVQKNHHVRIGRRHVFGKGVLIPVIGVPGVFIIFIIFNRLLSSQEQQEIVYLTFPLFLAGLTAFLLCARWLFPLSWSAGALRILMIVMLCWAGFVELSYDYMRARRVRQRTLDIAEQAAAAITEPAIIFTSVPFPFLRLVERDRVRVANPEQDNWDGFRQLLDVHLTQGHAAYGAFTPEQWGRLRQSGLLDPDNYTVRPLGYFSGIFCRISSRRTQEALP